MAPLLFEDIFNIMRIDPDGKKFDKGALQERVRHNGGRRRERRGGGGKRERRYDVKWEVEGGQKRVVEVVDVAVVSRIEAQSDKFDAYILLDVNIDVYRINKDKRYTIGLATTLDLDGTPDTGYYNQTSRATLADRYEYVMHGRTYRIADVDYEGQEKGEIYVSFGGLLMMLKVDKSVSKNFELDQRLFLLMKRTE
ncbi:DNA-directed RNA polymerases II and V subunit 8A [Bienertia sinuspersici]